MKKEGEYSKASLMRAEFCRQSVLDWLWANSSATFSVMLAGLNEQRVAAGLAEYPMLAMRGTVASMLQKGEIAATGPRKHHTFMPLAKTTESAESMRQRRLDRNKRFAAAHPREKSEAQLKREAKREAMNMEEVRQANIKARAEPWRTIHFAGDTPQSRESRGQGALREKATINCAMPI